MYLDWRICKLKGLNEFKGKKDKRVRENFKFYVGESIIIIQYKKKL